MPRCAWRQGLSSATTSATLCSAARASPVAASGHIYVAGRDGTVTVLSALPEIETLSVNKLEDTFDASPALGGDELFLRGRAHLYCIAEG